MDRRVPASSQVAEVLLQRTRSLPWACAVLAAAVLGLFIALLIR